MGENVKHFKFNTESSPGCTEKSKAMSRFCNDLYSHTHPSMDSPAPLSTISLACCTATASTSFQVKAQQIRFVGDNRTPVPWLHSQESCLRSLLQVLLFTQLHFEGATKNPGNAPLPCFNNLCTNTMKVRSVQAFPQIIHAAKMKRPQSDGERKGKVCVGG